MPVFSDDMSASVMDEVAPDLTAMLSEVLAANESNILTDSMTYSTTQSFGKS